MSLYCGIWGLTHIAHQIRLLPYPPLSRMGVLAFAIGHSGFLLGVMAPAFLYQVDRRPKGLREKAPWPPWLSEQALCRALVLLAPFQFAAVGIRLFRFLYQVQIPIGLMLTDPLSARRAKITIERAGEESVLVLLVRGIEISFSFSILLGLMIVGVYLATTKRRSIWVFVPIVTSVLQSLVALQRSRAVHNVLLMIFALVFARQFAHRGKFRLTAFKTLKLSLIVVLLVGALFVAIDHQLDKSAPWETRTDINPAIASLYYYFSGGVSGFDRYLEVHSRETAMYGASTFSLIARWLVRIGVLDPTKSLIPFRDRLILWDAVGRNTFTWFVNFYEDFKLWGIFFLPLLLGLSAIILYRAIRRKFTLTKAMLNSILWLAIAWSFYDFQLSYTEQFLAPVVVYLFERLVLKRGLLARRWRLASRGPSSPEMSAVK